jgi:hypothetical protein
VLGPLPAYVGRIDIPHAGLFNFRYEDIPLGSRLEVRCGSLPTHVQTICGPSTDALKFLIRFFPRDKNIRGQNSRDNMSKPFTIRHGRRACTEEKGREVVCKSRRMPLRLSPAPLLGSVFFFFFFFLLFNYNLVGDL